MVRLVSRASLTIFSTPTCPSCNKLKALIKENIDCGIINVIDLEVSKYDIIIDIIIIDIIIIYINLSSGSSWIHLYLLLIIMLIITLIDSLIKI